MTISSNAYNKLGDVQRQKSIDLADSGHTAKISSNASKTFTNVIESKPVDLTNTEKTALNSYNAAQQLETVEKDKSLHLNNSEEKKNSTTISINAKNELTDMKGTESSTNKLESFEEDKSAGLTNTEDAEDKATISTNVTNKVTNVSRKNYVTVTSPIPKVADDVRLSPKPSQTQPSNSEPTATKSDNVIHESNNEENTSDKLEKTRNKINRIDKTLKKLKEIMPKSSINKKEKKVHEPNSAESIFKKVLNKDLGEGKNYIIETCEPKTEVCLCDIDATSNHIVSLRRTMTTKAFEQYVKNFTCYRYKKPPSHFLLEPWKRKVKKRKHQKHKHCNKYFDLTPLQKNLKWDWIRRKRSLLSLNYDADDYVFEQDNHYESDTLPHRNKYVIKKPKKTIKKNYNISFKKNKEEGFEKLYKGQDNVYRVVKRRAKRTVGDMKEIAHGLRNLPPLQPKQDEVYAMIGDNISLDCLHGSRRYQKTEEPFTWETDRSGMLAEPSVVVDGSIVVVKKVEAKHAGNYTCSQNGKTRTVRLTVVTVPQLHVVFIPMYTSRQGCTYEDLRAMKQLGPLMSKETCENPKNCNTIQIDEPICMEDRDDASVHLRATAILTSCHHPVVKCSAQCRRDLQCAFALLCASNAPVLHGVKVVIERQAYNKTMLPSYGANRRLIVTHTLRKKDLRKHRAYHQLAAGMYPGNLDIVVSCPAGFYLIPKQKICAACPADTYAAAGENTCYSCAAGTSSLPGSSRCKLSLHRMRRYDWWWYPPCGYFVAAMGVLCACLVCTVCALVAHVTSRSTARDRGRPVSVNWVDSRWTWSRRTGLKRCSSTSAGVATRGEPPSPSAVILARFFRTSASTSRADSQEPKFEQWKEKNTQPSLPPIDFDLD
ncbi:hypothetical protein O0L34_g13320 [Tuta absoluta]|nr:hypothetical protein O0L34_g13320 [Tuta absoluta]